MKLSAPPSLNAFLKRKNIELSFSRYALKAMSAMAQGLFCTLLIGTILKTIGTEAGIDFLMSAGSLAQSMAGPAMAAAIGYALQSPPMVLFTLVRLGFILISLQAQEALLRSMWLQFWPLRLERP